tara:strand:+ start:30593 stop:32224 length:1632 start_codon:yes stop_codon:yes gene_type:complete
MAEGGFTFTQGLSPQQSSQSSGQGASGDLSDTIFKASNLIENKKRESMRQFELAQGLMRDDLKTMHGFDTSVGGLGQFSGALNELAEDARNKIKNAKDPIAAQEIIANFREQYNMAKSREEMITDKSKIFNAAVTASGAEIDGLNAGLDVNSEYVIPETSDVATAQKAWSNPYQGEIQIVDGRMMAVDSKDGQLKELGDIESTMDTSMYDLQTTEVNAGAIRDWSKSAAVYTDIGWSAGYWNADRAGQLYDDNILQTGRKEDRTEMGEWHRRQVLNTLEQRGMMDIFSPEERKRFVSGDFEGLDPEKTKKVIELGKEIFIEESKFSKEDALANKGGGSNSGDTDVTDPFEGYNKGFLSAVMPLNRPDPTTGATTMEYGLTSLPKPIEVLGSDYAGEGAYTIYGFGVNPNGEQVARIKRIEKVEKHLYTDKDGNQQMVDSAEEAIAAVQKINEEEGGSVANYSGDTEKYTKEKPETMVISQNGRGMDREVWNRIFSDDPVAANLLMGLQDTANKSILEELRASSNPSNPVFYGTFPDTPTRFDN